MALWRHGVYPLSQISNAGLTLVLWLTIGHLADTEAKQVAISSYTFGVPGSLIATLGIAFVLPNTFRSTASDQRTGPGPWSKPLRIALAASSLVCAAGIALCLLPTQTYKVQVTGATMTMAATIAVGIAGAQVGRTANRLWLVLVGQFAVPLTAIIWLVSIWAGGSDETRVRLACFLMALCLGLLVVPLAPYLGGHHTDAETLRPLLVASVVLLPHLLMFGIVVQGVRLLAVVGGKPPEFIQGAHVLMLAVSVGLTLLASINSYVAPNLQSAADENYATRLRGALRIYSAAALGAVLSVWGAIWIFGRISLLTSINLTGYLYVGISLVSVAAYYSVSAQCMRDLNTKPLTVASTSSAIILVLPTLLGAKLTFNGMLSNFAMATLALALIMSLIGALQRDRNTRFSISIPLLLSALWVFAYWYSRGRGL